MKQKCNKWTTKVSKIIMCFVKYFSIIFNFIFKMKEGCYHAFETIILKLFSNKFRFYLVVKNLRKILKIIKNKSTFKVNNFFFV